MIGATIAKRKQAQVEEGAANAELSLLRPKDFFDSRGAAGKSFQSYTEKLSLMFPTFSVAELFEEFRQNQLDILSTVESLNRRLRQLEIARMQSESSLSIEEQSDGTAAQIDYVLSVLSSCVDFAQARRLLEAFVERIAPKDKLAEQERLIKKLSDERDLLRRAFKVQSQKIAAEEEKTSKVGERLEMREKELDCERKTNFRLLQRLRELESRSSGDLLSSHRPIF